MLILRFQYLIFQGRQQLFAHRTLMQQCVHLLFPRPAGRHACKKHYRLTGIQRRKFLDIAFRRVCQIPEDQVLSNRICAIEFHSTGLFYRGRSARFRDVLKRKFFFSETSFRACNFFIPHDDKNRLIQFHDLT